MSGSRRSRCLSVTNLSVTKMVWVNPGTSRRSAEKCRRLITSSRTDVSATTVADRGPRPEGSSRQRNSPGWRSTCRSVDTSARAVPSMSSLEVAAGIVLTRSGEPGDEARAAGGGACRRPWLSLERAMSESQDRMPVGLSATSRTSRPGQVARLDANSLKRQSSIVLPALASNKHTRRAGAGALRELRDTILGLLRQPDETLCAECVATVLGRPVGGVMMTILGLHERFASFQGVCSTCHRYARVVRRES